VSWRASRHDAGREGSERLRPDAQGSADFARRFLDGGVDVLRAHVELLGDVLLGLQRSLVERLLQVARADDQERGLTSVDQVTELLDSVALLVGVVLSNLPEGLSSSSGLRIAGWTRARVVKMWLLVVAVSALSAALGYLLLDPASGRNGAFAQGFAAVALLAMITDTMLPEAYDVEQVSTGSRRHRVRDLAHALGDLSTAGRSGSEVARITRNR
jgi:hypothetical protein